MSGREATKLKDLSFRAQRGIYFSFVRSLGAPSFAVFAKGGSLQPGTPRLKRILAGFLRFCPPRFCCLGNFLPGCCRESAFGLTSARHPAITNTGNSTF